MHFIRRLVILYLSRTLYQLVSVCSSKNPMVTKDLRGGADHD